MALTRRQFLKRSSWLTAGSFVASGWQGNPWLRRALADALGDKFFVVIDLGGGNDGLNTVVPYDNGTTGNFRALYEQYRSAAPSGGLRIAQADLAATMIGADTSAGTPLALHPALSGLKSLWDLNKVAIIQGCGYPEANLSHALSEQKWLTGDPLGTGLSTGWVGRYLASHYSAAQIPAFSTQDQVPGEFIQSVTGVLATPLLANFALPTDSIFPDDQAAKLAAYTALYANAHASSLAIMRHAGTVGGAMLNATSVFPPLAAAYTSARSSWSSMYDSAGTATAQSLREVAKTIYGVVNGMADARFFEIVSGGYDTHADQGGAESFGQHSTLLAELGNALQIFYADCADMGVADKLCIVCWSEFGRRLLQNENGTDHGTQAPMFVIGGNVLGGLYGNHPNIDPSAVDQTVSNTVYSQAAADPHRSTDFRDVYGTLLKHWLGLSDAETLALLPVDSGNPALYWTSPDIDLPFLV